MENGIRTREISRRVLAAVPIRWALLVVGLAGCQPAPTPDPEPARVVEPAEFATWPRMTERPILVRAGLWLACISPTPEQAARLAQERSQVGPHFRYSIRVTVSPDGAAAYRENRPLPVGAVVVKEKYIGRGPADSLRAYAVMTKRREESAARGGGWEYAYVDLTPEAKVASGNLDHCAECHASARDRDFLFRSHVEAGR